MQSKIIQFTRWCWCCFRRIQRPYLQFNDKASGCTASDLLKKISYFEFLDTFLKNILNLFILYLFTYSKTRLKREASTFREFHLPLTDANQKSFNQQKIIESFNNLEDLNKRLNELNLILKEFEEIRITKLVEKYAKSVCNNIEARFT